jgi:hypothetical protein
MAHFPCDLFRITFNYNAKYTCTLLLQQKQPSVRRTLITNLREAYFMASILLLNLYRAFITLEYNST